MKMSGKSISSDSNNSSYGYMGKQVSAEADSNETVVLRNGENEKLKDKLFYGGGSTNAEMLSSWPPRLYTCSFCKRRFNSAQALGGHMNVHRRARAMLRSQYSSPWLSNSIISGDNPFQHDEHHFNYPNPNPHWPLYTSQYSTTKHGPSNLSHLPMFNNLTPSCSLVTITHKNSILPSACNCKHMLQAQNHHVEITTRERSKKNCIMAENHSNGLCSVTRIHRDHDIVSSKPDADQEDIDLELRLGF